MINIRVLLLLLLLLAVKPGKAADERWKITPDGAVSWMPDKRLPHADHIEMSGKQVSVILRYSVNAEGGFRVNKSMVWPLLRTIPNDTRGCLMRRFDWNPLNMLTVNGRSLENERVREIRHKGIMTVISDFELYRGGKVEVFREYLPAVDLPALVENYRITNLGNSAVVVEVPESGSVIHTDPRRGVSGSYCVEAGVVGSGAFDLLPGESLAFTAYISAFREGELAPVIDGGREKQKREELVDSWLNKLILETPDKEINTMFAFSKIRACESIYETSGGPMHGPGGESYYAAIWANDQAEYINPFFPFTGYAYGNQSALNSFAHFSRYMNPEYKPIPSSIIAEGLDFWNGAGDRGDAAMIAYGAARYALARGDRDEAEQLWPLIEWCLEFCRRKLNDAGVVMSDSDELENRFPSGDANLCTSSLYYDALVSAAGLAGEIGKPASVASVYRKQATALRKAMNSYFGAEVEGFPTYAYYKGNDVLRAWICIPLTMGITERTAGTIDALFSPRLWTKDGLLTQAGSETFWDRSTLYALRGVYIAGETEKATDYLKYYSGVRLLGEHVPYAIEAWPEGSQRHLSAESALYGRIITEGIFGIRPVGFRQFSSTPRLPKGWDRMSLREIQAFGTTFDVEVNRVAPGKIGVKVSSGDEVFLNKIVKEGTIVNCKL